MDAFVVIPHSVIIDLAIITHHQLYPIIRIVQRIVACYCIIERLIKENPIIIILRIPSAHGCVVGCENINSIVGIVQSCI